MLRHVVRQDSGTDSGREGQDFRGGTADREVPGFVSGTY